MSTLVLGNDVRRRTALIGGLALFALSLFLAGAIVGAWAGVVRIWPVRYSLLILEGPPKPFVNTPELPPLAVDSAGRLMKYAGKIEVPCPKQTQRTAVLLIAGQSNAANSAAQRHETRHPDRVLNFMGGRCYVAASPLLGSTGFAGESLDLDGGRAHRRSRLRPRDPRARRSRRLHCRAMGERRGAQHVDDPPRPGSRHALSGDARSLAPGRIRLRAQDRSRPIQGKSSCRSRTRCAPMRSTRRFSCRRRPDACPDGPNPTPSRRPNTSLPRAGLASRPGSTPTSSCRLQDRYDDCHMADSGEVKTARAWAALLAQHP